MFQKLFCYLILFYFKTREQFLYTIRLFLIHYYCLPHSIDLECDCKRFYSSRRQTSRTREQVVER